MKFLHGIADSAKVATDVTIGILLRQLQTVAYAIQRVVVGVLDGLGGVAYRLGDSVHATHQAKSLDSALRWRAFLDFVPPCALHPIPPLRLRKPRPMPHSSVATASRS